MYKLLLSNNAGQPYHFKEKFVLTADEVLVMIPHVDDKFGIFTRHLVDDLEDQSFKSFLYHVTNIDKVLKAYTSQLKTDFQEDDQKEVRSTFAKYNGNAFGFTEFRFNYGELLTHSHIVYAQSEQQYNTFLKNIEAHLLLREFNTSSLAQRVAQLALKKNIEAYEIQEQQNLTLLVNLYKKENNLPL